MTSEPQQARPQSPLAAGEPAPAIRFRAPNGSDWKVFEVDGARTGASLIFSSDEGFRRVRHYPADWRELDAESLWALSWER